MGRRAAPLGETPYLSSMPPTPVVRRHHPLATLALPLLFACTPGTERTATADLVLHNGHVYSLAWPEPSNDGQPHADTPFDSSTGWHHDATAVAVRDGRIVFVGTDSGALALRGPDTRVVDLAGNVVLPGLVDAHTHVAELGQSLDRVNLTGVPTEAEAVARIAERAATTPKGEWILGYGWDEGAWANRYPDRRLLSEKVPDHPVILRSLHGFAAWANDRALTLAGITRDTPSPSGGEIRKDASGEPTGLVLRDRIFNRRRSTSRRTDGAIADLASSA